jgi:PGF-pre-PGF domain-containing protein
MIKMDKNSKKMNKTILILISAIFLIGIVTATPLQDFMSDDVTSITMTITQDTTTNVFSMNTSGLIWDVQDISLPDGSVINSVPISELLEGINLRTDLTNGSTYPRFSNVLIDGSFTVFVLNNLLSNLDFSFTSADINADNSILTNLARDNLPEETPSAVGDSYFIKEGTTYTMGYSEGFGAIPNEYKKEIGDAIVKGVHSMNIQKVLKQTILPSISINDYLPVLEELGYEVSEENIDFANAILEEMRSRNNEEVNYNVSVDLTSMSFQDGTYHIPITITPLVGDEIPITKTITLVLSGIVNEVEGKTTIDGVYTPSESDFGIKGVINSIAGLTTGTIVTKIEISDAKPTGVNVLSHTTGLKYLVIEVDNQPGTAGAQISFSIDKLKVEHTSKVSLYVWETATSTWTKLATTLIGETVTEYKYVATTPHFSTFMIAEDTTTSGSNNHRSNGGTVYSSSTKNNLNSEMDVPVIPAPKIEENQPNFFQRILQFLGLTGRVTEDGTVIEPNLTPMVVILTFLIALLAIIIFIAKAKK